MRKDNRISYTWWVKWNYCYCFCIKRSHIIPIAISLFFHSGLQWDSVRQLIIQHFKKIIHKTTYLALCWQPPTKCLFWASCKNRCFVWQKFDRGLTPGSSRAVSEWWNKYLAGYVVTNLGWVVNVVLLVLAHTFRKVKQAKEVKYRPSLAVGSSSTG